MIRFEDFELQVPGKSRVRCNGNIADGHVVCIQGPSGSGKTTLLRCMAGLRPILGGRLYLDDTAIQDMRPELRRAGFLLQGPQLFPSMTVLENLVFPLSIRHPEWSEDLRQQRALQQLEQASLLHLKNSQVPTLSGGEAQRIAFCRMLLSEPRFFLLDEPFTGLDPENRAFFRDWFLSELKLRPRPTVMVSHDVSDANSLGARVIQWPVENTNRIDLCF